MPAAPPAKNGSYLIPAVMALTSAGSRTEAKGQRPAQGTWRCQFSECSGTRFGLTVVAMG